MKIAVVGAGALGSYFGAVLAQAGNDVALVGRRAHIDAIARQGILFQSGGSEQRVLVRATIDIAEIASARLVLFCVKSQDTGTAAQEMAPHLHPDAVVVSLQNGVDNVERIRAHTRNRVLPMLVYVGANIPAPGTVKHTGGSQLVAGKHDGTADLVALFGSAGLSIRVSEDIDAELWTKLVMNCAYNVICALSGAPYGKMVAMPAVRDTMLAVVEEVVQVARAKGVSLPGDIATKAIRFADAMPTTMSSTAQDIARGRRTEVDHLNGYVVRQGKALGIATPVNATLTALMKLYEQTKFGCKKPG